MLCVCLKEIEGKNTMLIGSLSLRPHCSFVLCLSSVGFCLLFLGDVVVWLFCWCWWFVFACVRLLVLCCFVCVRLLVLCV